MGRGLAHPELFCWSAFSHHGLGTDAPARKAPWGLSDARSPRVTALWGHQAEEQGPGSRTSEPWLGLQGECRKPMFWSVWSKWLWSLRVKDEDEWNVTERAAPRVCPPFAPVYPTSQTAAALNHTSSQNASRFPPLPVSSSVWAPPHSWSAWLAPSNPAGVTVPWEAPSPRAESGLPSVRPFWRLWQKCYWWVYEPELAAGEAPPRTLTGEPGQVSCPPFWSRLCPAILRQLHVVLELCVLLLNFIFKFVIYLSVNFLSVLLNAIVLLFYLYFIYSMYLYMKFIFKR